VARRARLTPPGRLAALLVLVLLLHAVALLWLAQQLEQRSALQTLATPMFTRLLRPETPAAVPTRQPAAAARPKRKRSGITSIAKSRAVAAARPASEAVAAAQAASAAAPPAPPASAETSIAAGTPDTGTPTQTAATAPDASTPEAATPTSTAAGPAGAPVASTPEVTPTIAAPATAAASAPATSVPGRDPALASWPADTRLTYRLGGYFRGDLHGDARVQWQRLAGQYQTRVEIDLTLLASLTLTSQGDVTPQSLVPRIYEELRSSGPRIARLGDNTITFNDGRTVPRPDGVQDTASQFVELSHRFATGQDALQVGRSVSLWLARPGGLDLWTYDIVQREILQTPELGPVEAYRLTPRPITNPRGNITAEIWFAPSLQYLPVRIRVHMGESTYVDLLVEKIEQR
jgi:Protein of unknown function (DUF3108)